MDKIYLILFLIFGVLFFSLKYLLDTHTRRRANLYKKKLQSIDCLIFYIRRNNYVAEYKVGRDIELSEVMGAIANCISEINEANSISRLKDIEKSWSQAREDDYKAEREK